MQIINRVFKMRGKKFKVIEYARGLIRNPRQKYWCRDLNCADEQEQMITREAIVRALNRKDQ